MSQKYPNSNHSSLGYLFWALFLLLLSVLGIYFLFQVLPQLSPSSPSPEPSLPSPSPALTTPLPTLSESTPSPQNTTPTPSLLPTPSLPAPTPSVQSFTPESQLFTAYYSSDRQVYQDQESSGLRYTFYRKDGNIALHLGPDWSWIHPQRVFTQELSVSTLPTFRYDINTQTIVDFETTDTKYTIQCVHNADPDLKQECQDFIASFLLN